jgi:hypothetical protein
MKLDIFERLRTAFRRSKDAAEEAIVAPKARIEPDPNQHVRDFLAYFVGFDQPPRYAVMLSGRWGAGKTHQAKQILDEILSTAGRPIKKPYVLISLYGLKSPQEIDDAMVAALYPWTDNDGVRIASSVGKAILKHAKIELPALKSADLINRMSAEVFVFDDLERCSMPITDSFGYINQLVERDGCKVIVLANQDEIEDQTKYKIGKEKLIGKTLEVEPNFDAAFESFLSGIASLETRTFFDDSREAIRDIYHQSLLKNLRILQQAMWDFERVYKVIDATHRASSDAMNHLLRLFFVLCFEHKSGSISSDDLMSRTGRSLVDALPNKDNPSPLSIAGIKYPGLYVYDSIISDEVACDILVRGVVNAHAVASALNSSSWFISENEPSWRTVWRSVERLDADVETAAKKMTREFESRIYTQTGEILHLFGQMLFLADIGFSGRDRTATLADCKAYVDDLRGMQKLERPREAYMDDIRHGSFAGLGFAQNDTAEFRELWSYMQEQRAAAEIDSYPVEAARLLEVLNDDPYEFVRQITYHADGIAPFANKPVLASVDSDEFADIAIALAPMAFREVLLGLNARYDMAKLAKGRELCGERDWVEKLHSAFLAKAAVLGPFGRDRITKNVDWTLGKELRELREAEAVQESIT